MDDETKHSLMELIDKSLLQHTVSAGAKEGGPEIADVYRLQALAEVHHYLKVEHKFTISEVAALMQFSDPLTVMMECWGEGCPEKWSSINDLLDEVGAFERFPLADPAEYAQRQGEKVSAVKAVLDQNMAEFHTALLSMDKESIIAQSEKITSMKAAHAYMKDDYFFRAGDAETLLRMENPLQFIANHWPLDVDALIDVQDLIGEVILDAKNEPSQNSHNVVEGKPSLKGQLHAAIKEVDQLSSPNRRETGGEAR